MPGFRVNIVNQIPARDLGWDILVAQTLGRCLVPGSCPPGSGRILFGWIALSPFAIVSGLAGSNFIALAHSPCFQRRRPINSSFWCGSGSTNSNRDKKVPLDPTRSPSRQGNARYNSTTRKRCCTTAASRPVGARETLPAAGWRSSICMEVLGRLLIKIS